MGQLTISCDACALRHSTACSDCVVTFVVEAEERIASGVPMEFDADQERVVHLFAKAGLVPVLRHREAS